jgi:methylglyoxal synthase
MKYFAGFTMRNCDFKVIKMMGGDPQVVAELDDEFIPQLAEYIWDHVMGEPEDPTVEELVEAIGVVRDMLYEMDISTRNEV